MPRILIAASGTGGHIFPALALAEALPSSWEVDWLGVPDRLENQIVPQQYSLTTVRLGGLQGNLFQKIFQFIRLFAATKFVISFIQERNIKVLFTTGGYISAPSILAAKVSGIKIILHESNAYPGRVTRALGRLCDVVALGLPKASQYLSGSRTVLTGTPVRKSFLVPQPVPMWVPSGKGPLIVVLGGSQGALRLNQMVRFVSPCFLAKGCRIVHLTGRNDHETSSIHHPNLVTKTFSDEIPGLLQHADLVISRAGAGTISELAICGTPAVLVPYPSAKDDHQNINALYAAECGAAIIIHENDPDHHSLLTTLDRLLANRLSKKDTSRDFLKEMQEGMRVLACREAEENLVEILLNLT